MLKNENKEGFFQKSFEMGLGFLLLQPVIKNGSVAEWLGRGLQNLVQRFESARNLRIHHQAGVAQLVERQPSKL